MAPQSYTPDSGYSTPDSELESIVPIHPTAVRRPEYIKVNSENTSYTDKHITANYCYRGADVEISGNQFNITPTAKFFEFQTTRKVANTGLMMIGMGGNNGSTLCATIFANKHRIFWHTKDGIQQPNYIGSVLRASTVRIGSDPKTAKEFTFPSATCFRWFTPMTWSLAVGTFPVSPWTRPWNALASLTMISSVR